MAKIIIIPLLLYTAFATKCTDSLNAMAEGLINGAIDPSKLDERALQMFLHSGKGLNDMGYYLGCQEDTDDANYYLISLSDTISAYIAICVPSECTKKELAAFGKEILEQILGNDSAEANFNATQIVLGDEPGLIQAEPKLIAVKERNDEVRSINAGAVLYMLFFFSILALCLAATGLDYYKQFIVPIIIKEHRGPQIDAPSTAVHSASTSDASVEMLSIDNEKLSAQLQAETEKPFLSSQAPAINKKDQPAVHYSRREQLLLCFSFYTNYKKLFTNRQGAKDPLDTLNSVRVMSMGWVILGHVFVNKLQLQPIMNPTGILDSIAAPNAIFFYGGFYAVDTFFWMAGLLMAFQFVKELVARNGRLKFGLVYFHRFWRILPLYMFVMFGYWALMRYLGDGPIWWNITSKTEECSSYWWTYPTFLNTIVPNGRGNFCVGWGWYLANDMQFFLITPPILFLYFKSSRLVGHITCIVMIFVHMIGTWLAVYHNDVKVVCLDNTEEWFAWYYVKPYCRIAPYAIGLFSGMIIYSYRRFEETGEVFDPIALKVGKFIVDNRKWRYIGMVVGLFCINLCLFIQYTAYKDVHNGFNNWTLTETAWFLAFDRIIFTTGLVLVLLPCCLGKFKILQEILSASAWAPLARLCYAVFLIHLVIITTMFNNVQIAIYWDAYNIYLDFITVTVISFVLAVPVCLMMESPTMALEKVMFARRPAPAK